MIRPKGRSPADEYLHKGKIWIEGRENSNYVIDLINHHWQRVMAIVSVDGVGVVDGKPASFESRGYIVLPNQTVSIPGWLVDHNTAAQFVFSKQQDSYAQQVDQSGNQGVIGVAWFSEKPAVAHTLASRSSQPWGQFAKGMVGSLNASNQILASGLQPEISLGTGFGESQTFATVTQEFQRASKTPDHVSLIYYDSATNLMRRGIKLKERSTRSGPEAFPGNQEFCAAPPGWVAKPWSKG